MLHSTINLIACTIFDYIFAILVWDDLEYDFFEMIVKA